MSRELETRLQKLEEQLEVLLAGRAVSSPWLRLKDVCESTGMSRWTIWRRVKAGEFPAPCRPYPSVERWASDEIDSWKAERLAERSEALNRSERGP